MLLPDAKFRGGKSLVIPGLYLARIQGNHPVERIYRLFEPGKSQKQKRPVIPRDNLTGVKFNYLVIAGDCVIELLKLAKTESFVQPAVTSRGSIARTWS
jgi:hypothetical protein